VIAALGLDLSLTSTGVARADGKLATIAPPAAHRAGRRLHWISKFITEHLEAGPPTIAVLEDVVGQRPEINVALGTVQGVVLLRMFELAIDVPIVHVKSNELKKYATGNGRADKDLMMDAAEDRAHEQGLDAPVDDDQADAFWLRQLAIDADDQRWRSRLVVDGAELGIYRESILRKHFGTAS
jgi:Holliday junction resolvasome RuvABC endonuclease subunit